MRCIDNIKDIILDCDYKPKKGLKHRVLVIPYKDIDRRYTTLNADKTEITHLQLLPSKRGYLFELNNAFKVSGSQKFSGGFTHELSIKIDKADSGNIATMNALTKGTYVLIVETTSNTFEVLGYEAGLVVNSVQRDYTGNVIGLTFATPSDVKELRMIALWGEGDYIAMSRKFENKALVRYNLLKGTRDFIVNGQPYHMDFSWSRNAGEPIDERFNGNIVRKVNGDWQGIKANIPDIIGEPVTISFWAKTNGTGKFGNFATMNKNPNGIGPFTEHSNNGVLIGDNKWHRYTIFNPKGMCIGEGTPNGFIEFNNVSGDIYYSSVKVEKGSFATDWQFSIDE
jgi:hypothetical protein|nr:MAG TPA: hypothetical protein [Caudoviricetes sp.]